MILCLNLSLFTTSKDRKQLFYKDIEEQKDDELFLKTVSTYTVLFSSHGSGCLSIKCLCLCSLQYLNLLENCCGMREGSVLILLCDICKYPAQTPAFNAYVRVIDCELAVWLVSSCAEEMITSTSVMMSSVTQWNHHSLSHHGDGIHSYRLTSTIGHSQERSVSMIISTTRCVLQVV